MRKYLIRAFFSWYISRIIHLDFKQLWFDELSFDSKRPILLLANHFSWWDGFLMFQMNRKLFKKKFHVMVTEENYRKVWFLKYLGAFSVNRHSREMIRSLEYAGTLLNDEDNLVLIFPQGKLYSSHVRQVEFEKGLIRVINASEKKFQYVFAASFVDYFENRKPTVRCYLSCWEGAEFTSLQLIKSAYNRHFELSKQVQNGIIV